MCSPGSAGIVLPAPIASLSDRGAAMAATLNAPPPPVRVPRRVPRLAETQACERVQSIHGIPVGIEHWTGCAEPDPLPLGDDDTLGGAIEDAVDGTGDEYTAQVRVYGWRGGVCVCEMLVFFQAFPVLDRDSEVRR